MLRRRGLLHERAWTLALAMAIDLLWGEPPAALHPVVWIGRLIARLERAATGSEPEPEPVKELIRGTGIVALTLVSVSTPACLGEFLIGRWPWLLRVGVSALALKPMLAARALFIAVEDVERPLLRDELPAARTALGRIVSRDVSRLDVPLVAAAAIESLAENLSDSVVAPWLAYLIGGLPLAATYRAANTLDAMLGYRGPKEYLGKAAARLDDALNLIPARMTAAMLVCVAPLVGGSAIRTAHVTLREHRRTASPNAGWPMAAAAGALDRCLEKRGSYRLHPDGGEPSPADLLRARRLAMGALAFGGIVVAAVLVGLPDPRRHPSAWRRAMPYTAHGQGTPTPCRIA